jgi:hypothetical protein
MVKTMRHLSQPQLWLSAAAITVVFLACTPKSEPKTVDYYAENKEARVARLKECENNVGTLKDDPDCVNAKQAAIKAWRKPNLPSFDPSSPTGQSSGPAASGAAK